MQLWAWSAPELLGARVEGHFGGVLQEVDRPEVEAVPEGARRRQRHPEPLLVRDAALAACQMQSMPSSVRDTEVCHQRTRHVTG